jgi:hypothetical protein
MTTQTEALKLALEALEGFYEYGYDRLECFEYITAIKEALAQPEQEPVAWEQFYPDIGKPKFVAQPEQEPVAWTRKLFSPELGEFFDYKDGPFARETDSKGWTPLYTTPPQRKPLTDERVSFEAYTIDPGDWNDLRLKFAWHKGFNEGARAIEAAHGIKGD